MTTRNLGPGVRMAILTLAVLSGPAAPGAAPHLALRQDAGDGVESVGTWPLARLLAAARAAANAGEWNESARLWEEVVARNPVNDEFWNTLAVSLFQARRLDESIPAFERVLTLRGGADPFAAYNIACAHALLGRTEKALDELERALDIGLPEFQVALEDEDLVSLREQPRFRTMMALIDGDAVSREVGWAHDLRLIRREVKRIGYDPFRLIAEEEFDRRIDDLISRAGTLDDARMKVACMKLMRFIGDGHTSFYGRFETVGVRYYLFEEGMFIIAADPRHERLLGAQVMRFDGVAVQDILEGVAPVQSRDNDHWLKEILPHRMRSPGLLHALDLTRRPDRYTLDVRMSGGAEESVTLDHEPGLGRIWNGIPESWVRYRGNPGRPLPLHRRHPDRHFHLEPLPERGLIYAQINRVRDAKGETFAEFCRRLFAAIDASRSGLILDMRANKGGNTRLTAPLLTGIVQRPELNRRGRLFIIAGRRTFSAAQNLATLLEARTEAIFAGEPTGSSPNFVGEENNFVLPYSGVTMSISNVRWVYASPFDRRVWIAPEIYAPPTFEAHAAGIDPVLDAILEFIEGQPQS